MERAMVYGLGKNFQKNRKDIDAYYDIYGYSDINPDKAVMKGYVSPEKIKEHMQDFDVVLMAARPIAVIDYLVDNLGIPLDKIWAWQWEREKTRLCSECIHFYGEGGLDAAVLLLLKTLHMEIGALHYLEIGTSDPVCENNSYNLYRMGARGVLVDALPGVRRAMEITRSSDKFIWGAVTDKATEREATFYVTGTCSGISSLHKEHHEKWKGVCTEFQLRTQELRVPLLGINELLASLDFMPDVIFVDAEGEDGKIVRGIDYDVYRPAIVVVEVAGMPNEEYEMLRATMDSAGYICYTELVDVGETIVNAIFVDRYKYEHRS